MGEIGKIIRRLLAPHRGPQPIDPVPAYDLWAATYDQTDNLLVDLDETLFSGLLRAVAIRGRTVLDVGCGTGRHWTKLLAAGPAALIGVDSSMRMLERLREKYPAATTMLVGGHLLPDIPDQSQDVLVSTLALAHFADVGDTLAEWSRVVRAGGDVVITDLHPEAVARGACTFRHGNRTLAIRLHSRGLDAIVETAARHGLELVRTEQRAMDRTVEGYFDSNNASEMFARLKGLPLIYGLHLKKGA